MVIGESGNGTEALELITRDKPDLVLADIVMPGLNGIELLKQTRQAGLNTKFIMLTCMGEFEYVRQAMEYGASNYILKLSMSVGSLRDTLRKVSAELSAGSHRNVALLEADGIPAVVAASAEAPDTANPGPGGAFPEDEVKIRRCPASAPCPGLLFRIRRLARSLNISESIMTAILQSSPCPAM